MKRLLIPLLAVLALPTAVNANEVINSQFPDILSASQIASIKTTLQCREEF